MLDIVLFGKCMTGVTTWSLSIAENRCKLEYVIERLEAFSRKYDCGSKMSDKHQEVEKKVKFCLCEQDTWCALSRDG